MAWASQGVQRRRSDSHYRPALDKASRENLEAGAQGEAAVSLVEQSTTTSDLEVAQ